MSFGKVNIVLDNVAKSPHIGIRLSTGEYNGPGKDIFKRQARVLKALANELFPFPMGGGLHHYILPGVILSCLRNNGYEITDREIEEGMKRGAMLAAHSCGFTGISGAAHGVGIVASIVNRITPMHDERSGILSVAADTLIKISRFRRRCCKRSNFAGIENAVKYLSSKGHMLPSGKIECRFFVTVHAVFTDRPQNTS